MFSRKKAAKAVCIFYCLMLEVEQVHRYHDYEHSLERGKHERTTGERPFPFSFLFFLLQTGREKPVSRRIMHTLNHVYVIAQM